jgi:hypothetical protein
VFVDQHPAARHTCTRTRTCVSRGNGEVRAQPRPRLLSARTVPEEDDPLLVEVGDGRHQVQAEDGQLATTTQERAIYKD